MAHLAPAMPAAASASLSNMAKRAQKVFEGSGLLGDAALLDNESEEGIGALLASKHRGEQLKGMRRLLALVSQGKDVSKHFPSVVNLLGTPSLELKRLVYVFVAKYSEVCQDEALLSVNAFQRDLSAVDISVRSLALRSMSGIRLSAIVPIVAEAVRRCARDPSAAVRRAAAAAVPKVFSVDRVIGAQLADEIGSMLMNDSAPSVVGVIVNALFTVTHNTVDKDVDAKSCELLHSHFRRLCTSLGRLDEWAQVTALEWLLRYSRHHFTDPNLSDATASATEGDTAVATSAEAPAPAVAADDTANVSDPRQPQRTSLLTPQQRRDQDSFYDDDEGGGEGNDEGAESTAEQQQEQEQATTATQDDEQPSSASTPAGDAQQQDLQPQSPPTTTTTAGGMSKDHALLLNHVRPLIASRNNAVILSACRLLLHAGIASEYDYHRCAASLTFALRANSGQRATMMAVVSGGDPQAQECLLQLLLYLCVHHPQTVRPYLRRLLVDHVCDTPRVVALKLDCYSHLASAENLPTLIGEFQSCIAVGSACGDLDKVCAAVLSLANCALRVPSVVEPCLRTLVALSCSNGTRSLADDAARAVSEHAARCACVLVRHAPEDVPRRRAMETLVRAMRPGGEGKPPRLAHGAARARVLATVAALLEAQAPGAELMAAHALAAVSTAFANESAVAKLAALTLASEFKRLGKGEYDATVVLGHLVNLARLDVHRDVRDKARQVAALHDAAVPEAAMAALLGVAELEEIGTASGVAAIWQMTSGDNDTAVTDPGKDPGSLSQLVGHAAPGWAPLPAWPEVATPDSVRDPPAAVPKEPPRVQEARRGGGGGGLLGDVGGGGDDSDSAYTYEYSGSDEDE